MVELDVHLWHRRLEVRHAKRLWLSRRLWEQRELLERGTLVPDLDQVLAALPDPTRLLVDLKGWSPRLARMVRSRLADADPVVVSARSWWLLRGFGDRPATTTLRSVGTSWQLWIAMRLPCAGHGVVVHQRLLDLRTARRLVDRYETVFAWDIESEARARELLDMGVVGLIIDDVALITALRARRDA